MKNSKSVIINTVMSLLATVALLFIPATVSAQTGLLFAVTPYETREDIDFLIDNSVHPLDYLEGEEIDTPVFLSIISLEQQDKLVKAGFQPKILDQNAGKLEQYYLMEYRTGGSGYELKGFEVTEQITPIHTVIKLPAGTHISDLQSGAVSMYTAKRYKHNLVPPPLRTRTSDEPQPTRTPRTQQAGQTDDKFNAGLGFLIFGVLFGGGLWQLNKRSNKS